MWNEAGIEAWPAPAIPLRLRLRLGWIAESDTGSAGRMVSANEEVLLSSSSTRVVDNTLNRVEYSSPQKISTSAALVETVETWWRVDSLQVRKKFQTSLTAICAFVYSCQTGLRCLISIWIDVHLFSQDCPENAYAPSLPPPRHPVTRHWLQRSLYSPNSSSK